MGIFDGKAGLQPAVEICGSKDMPATGIWGSAGSNKMAEV
jgi:hypothetical protein